MEKKKTSPAGLKIIKTWETLRLKPYRDPTGKWTIGWGHTRMVDPNMPPITERQADDYLRTDVLIAEAFVNSYFPNLRQCQFDALVSLVFNIKVGAFKKTKLFEILRKDPDSRQVAYEWIEFSLSNGIYLRGLLRRRIEELRLYYSW